ncbi:hypothetical protein B0A48_03744 [Cryoendolithus antarcticus]|uniref:RBR-type E3 ubiquitin transferase n=1 Tax=Cryoendolithus antarcticus TaxID=1507870 RepID=A0A1V8TGE5_9PEZI|nr:hypothetical protein B0A48_03744 [Cryoendolithus antarcticus]
MSLTRKPPPSVGVRGVHGANAAEGLSRIERLPVSNVPSGLSKALHRRTPISRSGEQQQQQHDHLRKVKEQRRGLYAFMHRKQHTPDALRSASDPLLQHSRSSSTSSSWDSILRQRKTDLNDLFEPGTYVFTTKSQLLEDLTMLALHVATLLDNTDVPPLSRRPETVPLSGRDKEAKLMYELRSSCLGVVLRLSEKSYTDRATRLQVLVNSAVMSSDFLLLPDSPIVPNVERCNVARQLEYGRMLRHWIALELENLPAACAAEGGAKPSTQWTFPKPSSISRTVDGLSPKRAQQIANNAFALFEPHTYIYTSCPQLLVDLGLVYLHLVALMERDPSASSLSTVAADSNIDSLILHLRTCGHVDAASMLAMSRYDAAKLPPVLLGAKGPLVPNARRMSTPAGCEMYAQALSDELQIECIRLFGIKYTVPISFNAADEVKRQNQAAMEALVAAEEFRENPFRAAKQEKDAWASKIENPTSGAQNANDKLAIGFDDPLQGSSKSKGRTLPPISEIDWADVPEDEVRQLVESYNDSPSPADSGIGFPHVQDADAAEPYVGKGKRRASPSNASSMPGTFPPSPHPYHPLPANGNSSNRALLDNLTDPSDDDSDLFHLPWDKILAEKRKCQASFIGDRHTKALHDAHMAQELARRLEHDARNERELMEVEDALMAARIAEEETIAAAEAARIKAAASLLKSCVVCGDDKLPCLYPTATVSTFCTHEIATCKDCLQGWLTSELDSKGTESIKCPECPSVLTPEDFLRCAPTDLAQKFDRLLTRSILSALPGFAWCLAAGCDSGQVNIENASYMKCVACSHEVCLSCKVKWHQGKTCAEYGAIVRGGSKRRKEEEKSEKLVQGMSKICPGTGCGARIEKGGGCDQ